MKVTTLKLTEKLLSDNYDESFQAREELKAMADTHLEAVQSDLDVIDFYMSELEYKTIDQAFKAYKENRKASKLLNAF